MMIFLMMFLLMMPMMTTNLAPALPVVKLPKIVQYIIIEYYIHSHDR